MTDARGGTAPFMNGTTLKPVRRRVANPGDHRSRDRSAHHAWAWVPRDSVSGLPLLRAGPANLKFVRQPSVSFGYKTIQIDRVFRPDLIVENSVIVELKSVEKLMPIHDAQLQTYLKLTGLKTGLIFNFNTRLLKSGIRRIELYSRFSPQRDVSPTPDSPTPPP